MIVKMKDQLLAQGFMQKEASPKMEIPFCTDP